MSVYDPRTHTSYARILQGAISNNDHNTVKVVLRQIDTVDCAQYTLTTRPLCNVLETNDFEMADILIAHSASPNYVCRGRQMYIAIFSESKQIVYYLLQRGSWVPRSMWDNPWVAEYTGRSWDLSNHASWPDSVRAQMRTLLLITGTQRGTPLRRDLLFYLFRWVLSAYWTLVDG